MSNPPATPASTIVPQIPVTNISNIKLRHVIRCTLSGLFIGELEVITTAGSLPYLSHWNDMVARHPVFSMSPAKLLQFTTNEWHRLGKKAVDEEITNAESNILCVCYLALLHSLDCIKQDKDIQVLPPLHVTISTMSKLLALSYWKHYLESQRFKFPTYHISRLNNNGDFSDIDAYLELCFEIKSNYEKKVNDAAEKEKLKAADDALKALNREWVIPPSKKVLWKWILAYLQQDKTHKDDVVWIGDIFLGGPTMICNYDKEDLELMEEIIDSVCPPGTGIMLHVRGRLKTIRKIWELHNEAFEIDLSDYAPNANVLVNGHHIAPVDPGPMPILNPGDSRSKFAIALAKWTIAHKAWSDWTNKRAAESDGNSQLESI